MSSYLQMGHNTENLVGAPGLDRFSGVVLSPVNRDKHELAAHVNRFRQLGEFDIVFDPQFYIPRATRGKLPTHTYFPSDLESADLSSSGWWRDRIADIVECATQLNVNAVCSPITLPATNKWTDGYYAASLENYNLLRAQLEFENIRPLLTVIVNWDELEDSSSVFRIASILTQFNVPQDVYLIIDAEVSPRVELRDERRLLAAMNLISILQRAGSRVMVAHCSSDMVLFKAAGASDCSTGSHFNLRRFTRSRFANDDEAGGRQIPYWFEQGMLAFLREADIRRVLNEPALRSVIGTSHSGNIFATDVLAKFSESLLTNQRATWQALSWRQYLAWFSGAEAELSQSGSIKTVRSWLKNADENWGRVEENDIFLEERRNDGSWIRSWLQALSQFSRNS